MLGIFDPQVIMMLPTKFQVNWLFRSGEELKIKMANSAANLDFLPNNFGYFWSTNHHDASYQVSSQLAF